MLRHARLTALLIVSMSGSIACAQQPPKDAKPDSPAPVAKPVAQPPGKPTDKVPAAPPGMTEADMKACMDAATPGPMHAFLAEGAGTWSGKVTMWMAPGTEPTTNDCTTVVTAMMDGRFTRGETRGEMAGMGMFEGFGLYGYDNVSKKFQSTWVDNMGTGMMIGKGELSPDGKTLSWTCTYNCPIKKGPITMREIERRTGKDSMTMEMFGPDPQGKEFKMMEIKYTRKGAGEPGRAGANATPSKAAN